MTIRLTMAFSDNPRVQPLKDGAEDNVWFNGRTRELSHGGALGLDKAAPKGVAHHWLTADPNARPDGPHPHPNPPRLAGEG
jgi:hypothetical protein